MEILLEEKSTQTMYYYCLCTDEYRYDLMVSYTDQFFGKTMVISLQTGKMVLMCLEDIDNEEVYAEKLGIKESDIESCKSFLRMVLNEKQFASQY